MKYPVSTAKNTTAVWLLFRPHRSTTYVEVVYCYRRSSVHSLSVGLTWSLALQKTLNRSRCCLGCGLEWVHGSMS